MLLSSTNGLIDRRQALVAGALGTVGLSLPQLLAAETAGRPARASRSSSSAHGAVPVRWTRST